MLLAIEGEEGFHAKAPPGMIIARMDTEVATAGAMDLQNAYDWYLQVAADAVPAGHVTDHVLVERNEKVENGRAVTDSRRLLMCPLGQGDEVRFEDYLASELRGVKHVGHRDEFSFTVKDHRTRFVLTRDGNQVGGL